MYHLRVWRFMLLLGLLLDAHATAQEQASDRVTLSVSGVGRAFLFVEGARVPLPTDLPAWSGARVLYLGALRRGGVVDVCRVERVLRHGQHHVGVDWSTDCVESNVVRMPRDRARTVLEVDGRPRTSVSRRELRLPPGRHVVVFRTRDAGYTERQEVDCDQSQNCTVVSSSTHMRIPSALER
jgi:hypothetical protein